MSETRDTRLPFSLEPVLVGLLFGSIGLFGVIYGIGEWAPELASRHGAGIDAMMTYLMVTTGAMFLIGHLAMALFIWQGSRRTRISHRLASPRFEKRLSIALGVLMAVVAEGGVVAIGLPVWNEYFMAEAPPDAVTVEVVGQQFFWNVRYPGADGEFGATDIQLMDDVVNPIGLDRSDPAAVDDIVWLNEIYVPVNRPVRVVLRSKDMIHSFFLPHLRVKQDVIPGMVPELVFVPTREGTFELACAELCGLGHYRMQGFFHVVSDAEFTSQLERLASEQ
ncbi:MAG: hypothetical protein QF463_16140 [Vicinamibacterales bacterium]|jgi:cytochrome c oxidase subunit 2|nr:hypothetical protein [Acidobacteriota bacterium]MDP6372618.1 hypothetical protein [Vicinamibacterales bacterium]MDP6610596.1 hypothetical protein [Vicinamibacterales bacterium]HAK54961.1 hypothetical protein [Acidobacteriota bacterium]|tara:strand:- start:4226 stop:5062 length:837 start_codon:yes stop_codon:yes gene_type:complete